MYAFAPTACAACCDSPPVCTRTLERSAPSDDSNLRWIAPGNDWPLDDDAVAIAESAPSPTPFASRSALRWIRPLMTGLSGASSFADKLLRPGARSMSTCGGTWAWFDA
ncbi:MAG TPA: hypothetical protein VH143_20190 [Kofleriaceae bacterium]|nr:hypothetical protein [Kofleriaceae bacterium]